MTTGQVAPADPRLRADIEAVKRIVLQGLGAYRARVWLFWSRARGRGGRSSDIDVAILPVEPLPAGTLAQIEEALENSQVLYPVDLVDLSHAVGAHDLLGRPRLRDEEHLATRSGPWRRAAAATRPRRCPHGGKATSS